MIATNATVRARPARRRPALAATRLLRRELWHNAMLWMLPVAVAVFWFVSYRKIMAAPPLWDVRASDLQSGAAADFIVPVTGAAAWMGSREARRRMTDLVTTTARPRWARLLVTWAATAIWAVVGFLVCLVMVYGGTAHQVSWGGPLWWPAAVAAASVIAYSAIGFAAGTLLPSRLTAPVVAIVSFFVLVLSTELIVGSQSYWNVSPVVSGPWDVGSAPEVATFYRYVPDLSVAQLMFLAGVALAVLGALALPAGGRRAQAVAAVVAAAGVLAAGTGVRLVGTGTLDAHGMISIPALHDAATDRPLPFTPVCSHTVIPVCLNPAYARDLPTVAAALNPVLREIAGLPGAPVRVIQAAASYQQGRGNGVNTALAGRPLRGEPPEFRLLLPDQTAGPLLTARDLAGQLRGSTVPEIIASFVGDGSRVSQAQYAVAVALSIAIGLPPTSAQVSGPPVPRGRLAQGRRSACSTQTSCQPPGSGVLGAGTAVYAAAQRFAALPVTVRRDWLARHLPALRAGQLTLAQLP